MAQKKVNKGSVTKGLQLGLSLGIKKEIPVEVEERSFFLSSSWWLTEADLKEYKKDTDELIEKVTKGVKKYTPELLSSGEGGVYLLRSETGENLAVFKPFDEDPFSPRNPKSPISFGKLDNNLVIGGYRAGESTQKEVAAYLLDRGFANVPLAVFVRITGGPWGFAGKHGSLHHYIPHLHDSWEISASLYSLADFQRIAVFDLRILNTDRHGGNILVLKDTDHKGGKKLVPIDHAFCLPDNVTSCGDQLWFEWMSWPQANLPLLPEIMQYLKNINLEADSKTLRALGISEEAIFTMVWCSTLLRFTLLRGLTLFETAEIIRYRARGGKDPQIPQPSLLACSRTDRYVEQSGLKRKKTGNYSPDHSKGLNLFLRQKSAPHSLDIIWNGLCKTKQG